jgi:hypothetical protein
MVPKHGDSQQIIRDRRVKATEMDVLRRSSRISRKERIRNVTGLEETIVKEIEQNQLTWYGHVWRMAEGRLPKIALKWMVICGGIQSMVICGGIQSMVICGGTQRA